MRSHSETLRILQQLGLDGRLVLSAAHFLALPAIIARTDLAVVMPQAIALRFADADRYALLPADLPRSTFTVSLHWSARFESDPAHRWMRQLFAGLFKDQGQSPLQAPLPQPPNVNRAKDGETRKPVRRSKLK